VQGKHTGATDAGADHYLPGTHFGDDRVLPYFHGPRAGRQPAGAPLSLANACKDLHCLESMANAATVTTTMASAAKNSFAGAVAQGGAGPEDYVPHLTDFVGRANGVS
jgi:3-hydroxyisobutyrate dehydrogenase-like beta-hydroxyacid dehydrogenase